VAIIASMKAAPTARPAAAPQALPATAAHERQEQRHRGGGDHFQVGDAGGGHLRFGPEQADDGGRGPVHQHRNGDRQQQPPDDRLPRQPVGPRGVAGADRLGDQDRGPDVDGRQDGDDEEDELEADADAGHRRRAQPRHQEGIDGADQRVEQVLADDRRGQGQHALLGHRRRRGGRFVDDGRRVFGQRRERRLGDVSFDVLVDGDGHATSGPRGQTLSIDRATPRSQPRPVPGHPHRIVLP
jgi:hypothetical protein